MTDPHDDLDRWLRPSVEPIDPPPGTFAAIRRRARRRRWARAVSSGCAVALICVGGVFGGLLAAGGDKDDGINLPPPVVASSAPSSPTPGTASPTPGASTSETPSTPSTDAENHVEPEPPPDETPGSGGETETPDDSGTETGTEGPTPDEDIAACRTSELAVEMRRAGAGAGSVYWDLVFVNQAGSACRIEGYPDLVLLDGDREPLSTDVHTMSPGPSGVLLAPGESASATVRAGNVRSGERDCQPPSEYASVTPPGASEHVTTPFEARSCNGDIWVTGVVEGDSGAK